MDGKEAFNRRQFVHLALLGTGSICLLPRCTGNPSGVWRFFTDAEAVVIDALAEQIIPADDWPGGRDAGVTNFIDKQLKGPYARFQATYRDGIAAVGETCLKRYGKKFQDLAWEEQTAFLEELDGGSVTGPPWKEGAGQVFFRLVRDHTMQAYYGSPRHGGNKNYISYKMLDLDYPHILGQNRYSV